MFGDATAAVPIVRLAPGTSPAHSRSLGRPSSSSRPQEVCRGEHEFATPTQELRHHPGPLPVVIPHIVAPPGITSRGGREQRRLRRPLAAPAGAFAANAALREHCGLPRTGVGRSPAIDHDIAGASTPGALQGPKQPGQWRFSAVAAASRVNAPRDVARARRSRAGRATSHPALRGSRPHECDWRPLASIVAQRPDSSGIVVGSWITIVWRSQQRPRLAASFRSQRRMHARNPAIPTRAPISWCVVPRWWSRLCSVWR